MKTLFLGFVGNSGSGKTTLIEKLIKIFSKKGYKVGAIKHDAHNFEIDYPGKDSYRMKHAGAKKVVLASKDKIAMVEDLDEEIPLKELKRMFKGFDLVFVEGYRLEDLHKIEVHRSQASAGYLIEQGIKNIVMVASDEKVELGVPVVDLNEIEKIVEFIENFITKV